MTRKTLDMTVAEADPDAAPSLKESPAAAMMPEQLLQPGEIIILLLKPSLWYVILASLRSLAIIGIVLLLAVMLERQMYDLLGVDRRDLIMMAMVVTGLRLFWQFLEWLSRVYILTDRRIVRVQGVIRVSVFEAQLKQIQHTSAIFTLRERLFGLGTLTFATAGTAFTEAEWVMLAKPLEVHHKVVQTINRYR